MSTRALIGVGTPAQFRAVYHRFDSAPWDLGNALLIEHMKRRGDLAALLAELVEAPHGWESFPERTRSSIGDNPPFFGPEHLPEAGWMQWLYLFRPEERLLEVYAAGALSLEGTAARPFVACRLLGDGASEPPFIATPVEPPAFRELPPGEGGTAEAATAAAALAEEVGRRAAARNLDVHALPAAVARLLASAIHGVRWTIPSPCSAQERARREQLGLDLPAAPQMDPSTPDRVWVLAPYPSGAQPVWRLDLPGLALSFPSPAPRRPFLPTFDPSLHLWAPGGARATLDVGAALMRLADGGDLAHLLVESLAAVADPGAELAVCEGTLLAFKTVVDAVSDPGRELSLEEARALDPAVALGDALAFPHDHGPPWPLLDWLHRAFRSP